MEPANFSICNYEFLTNLQTAIFPTPTVKSSSSLCKSLCGQFNKVVRATSVRKLHSIFALAEIHTKRPPLPLPLTLSHFLTKKHSRTIPGKSIIFIIKRIKNFVRKTFPHFSHETTSRFFLFCWFVRLSRPGRDSRISTRFSLCLLVTVRDCGGGKC